ncbi:IF44L protein, partial [Atractosteus spatula]|nr:IF44L protein [Atractosteus spatula]
MKEIRTLTPQYKEAEELRIMITGEDGGGKSSYINTIDSALQGYVTSRALASGGICSFTKKFKPFRVEDCANGEGDGVLPFVIYDVMPIDKNVKSPDVFISMAKGHIKDGYTFNPIKSISDDSPYFNKNPTVNDVAHCLVYLVAADYLNIMDDHVLRLITEIRSAVSDTEISYASKSLPNILLIVLIINDLGKAVSSKYYPEWFSHIFGIPVNCILPVKNYSEEISLNDDIDVLALTALLQILRFANGHLLNLTQMGYKK